MIVRRSLQEHFTVEEDEYENVVPFIVADFLAQAEKNLPFYALRLTVEGDDTMGEGVH